MQVDPSKLKGRAAQKWWTLHNKNMKMQITGLKSSLSAIWRAASINAKWSWSDDAHTTGTGNATLADELNLLKQKTKRQDLEAGKVKKQAARIEQEDLVLFQTKARLLA